MLRTEYDSYIKTFNDNVQNVTSASPRDVSEALITLSGIKFRVGQILAELEAEYSANFAEYKAVDVTDRLAKSNNAGAVDEKTAGCAGNRG
jgi:hypothetical protein